VLHAPASAMRTSAVAQGRSRRSAQRAGRSSRSAVPHSRHEHVPIWNEAVKYEPDRRMRTARRTSALRERQRFRPAKATSHSSALPPDVSVRIRTLPISCRHVTLVIVDASEGEILRTSERGCRGACAPVPSPRGWRRGCGGPSAMTCVGPGRRNGLSEDLALSTAPIGAFSEFRVKRPRRRAISWNGGVGIVYIRDGADGDERIRNKCTLTKGLQRCMT